MNNNLPPFYVGQRIVALKTSLKKDGLQIIKGNHYTVYDVYKCSGCKNWIVELVELRLPPLHNFNIKCCVKSDNLTHAGGNAKNFAPIQENFQSITYQKY